MALDFMDGFEHYGTGGTGQFNMVQGVYAQSTEGPTTTRARTGTRSLPVGGGGGLDSTNLRRVFLTGERAEGGFGCGWFMTQLPTADNALMWQIRTAGNATQFSVTLRSNGALRIYRGTETALLYESPVPNFVAGAWQHIEVAYKINSTTGYIEVRLNNVTIGAVSDVNTQGVAGALGGQFAYFRNGLAAVGTSFIDDLFSWNKSGTTNNDFIGDHRVLTQYPIQDTAQADMTPVGTVTGFDAINDVTPDGDTTYLNSPPLTGTDKISDFVIQPLPAEVAAVAGVQVYAMCRKDDVGICEIRNTIVSGGVPAVTANIAITEAFAYYTPTVDLDPNTGAPFTPASFNASLLRLRRVA